MEAFETALTNFPDLVDHKLGSAGHEVGAQQAILTLRLAEAKWGDTMKYAGLAIQPMSGAGSPPEGGTWQELYLQVRSPLVMFRAAEDPLIPERFVQATYDALSDSTEAYFWSVVGADGVLIPDVRNQEIAVAWFRWKLLSDQNACRFFKALPEGPNWERNSSKNEQACE